MQRPRIKWPFLRRSRQQSTTGLWFRVSTRARAGGYWLRENAQSAARIARRGGKRAAEHWDRRSNRGKIQIAAVAGVLVLWALLKFTAVPGVPCEFSAARECAPGDETVALVPADALLYAHVTLDGDTAQSERAGEVFGQLAELERVLVGGASAALPAPSGAAVDLREDVLGWAERDLAVALLPGAQEGDAPPDQVILAGVGDREEAEKFVATIAPPVEPAREQQDGASVDVYPGGFAAAFIGEQLAFGGEQAVRAVLDAESGSAPGLEGSPENAARDELSDSRFAEVYVSRAGVQQLLAGRVGPAAQLESFVDYAATAGLAAAVVAEQRGLQIELVSALDPELAESSPGVFSELPEFEPGLASEAGERAIGYVGVGELGPTLAGLLDRAGPDARGLAGSLQALAARLESEAGVNPLQDLLPALGGEAALVAESTDAAPFASLIVEGVDEEPASQALARLQGPLLQAIGAGGGAQVPRLSEQEVGGVTVRSVQVSPAVNLAYAVFDEKLVVSTDPKGIEQVRSGSGELAASGTYERAIEELPERVSALVFFNLDELFGQIVNNDLAEDPIFADLTVLLENASSVGLAVNAEDDRLLRTELFLAVD